jgi:hypothetical protein
VPEIEGLLTKHFVTSVGDALRTSFAIGNELDVVDIGGHLLKPGQTIRIHNDYLDGNETHRLLIQLNRGWGVKQGGLLMQRSESLVKTIIPAHRSGFAFEISRASFHAVSTIADGERFTLVYTYRARSS